MWNCSDGDHANKNAPSAKGVAMMASAATNFCDAKALIGMTIGARTDKTGI
jgi:hypothetical protein